MFNGLSQTYSLVNVVAEHIKMFLDNNIDTTIIVSETINDNEKWGIFLDKRLKWIKIVNKLNGKQIKWYDYNNSKCTLHNTFYDEVDIIANDFENKLKDFDFCFMHDVLYQGWHYIHNIAIRKAQKKLPNLKFISFTQSFPVTRPKDIDKEFEGRYTSMPNTIFAYPTKSGLNALANQYNVPINKCVVINNSIPILDFLDNDIKELNKKTNFIDADILIVYPGRLTPSKKFEHVSSLVDTIKEISNKTVKIIFCDFNCMDVNSNTYKKYIINEGINYGLNKEDIIFTSDYGYEKGFPRKAVLDLFTLSNLYICPSFSESFGLTVLEAASRGNFIILNKKVPALEELGNNIHAYFMCWEAKNNGYDTIETYYPSKKDYYIEHAKNILKELNNPVILAKTKIRTNFNNKAIFNKQIKPLLENYNLYK